MFIRWISFTLLLAVTLSASARMSPLKNDHPAFKLIKYSQLAKIQPEVDETVPLSILSNAPVIDELHFDEIQPISTVSLVGTASFDLGLLTFPKIMSLGESLPDLSSPSPIIAIANTEYVLWVVEITNAEKEDVRYITALVVGHKGHARFIIDNQSNEVVGSLDIDGELYRIVSRQNDSSQQLIYRLLPSASDQSSLDSQLVSLQSNVSSYRLEKALVKTELLLGMAPHYYEGRHDRVIQVTSIEGGNLGVIDVGRLAEGVVSPQLTQILSRFGLLTEIDVSYQFVVSKINRTKKGRVTGFIFQQVIDGSVFENKSNLYIHSKGHISNLRLEVINTQHDDFREPVYDADQVLTMANTTVLEQKSPKLLDLPVYRAAPLSTYMYWAVDYEDGDLSPVWLVVTEDQLSDDNDTYVVFVNAKTGLKMAVMKYQPQSGKTEPK